MGVAAWSWVTRAGVLLAGHPAQAITVVVIGAVGALLLTLGCRDLVGARHVRARRTWIVVIGRALALVLSVLVLGAMIYLRPFGASADAIDAVGGSPKVSVQDATTTITLTPTASEPRTGLIFQPGARVDPRAYVPLMSDLAEQGTLVVIVKQPFFIGFTAIGAPGEVITDHPGIDDWVVGGHSLGGVAASSYAGDHPDQIAGLLLWASYPLDSLADTDLAVTSVSGTADGLAVPADLENSRIDLPADTSFVAVKGAVHAFFGDYGEQPGDGMPTVPRAEAQQQIVDASAELLSAVSSR